MGEGKLISLARAAGLVADGDHITIGGVMLHRIPSLQPGATLEEVTRRTGFTVEPLGDLESLSPPTPAELAALEALDPDRLRDLDFR